MAVFGIPLMAEIGSLHYTAHTYFVYRNNVRYLGNKETGIREFIPQR